MPIERHSTNSNGRSVDIKIGSGVTVPWFAAWLIMLVVGGIHHTYRQVPAFGYWITLGACFILVILGALIRGAFD